MGKIGTTEWLILIAILLLLFGANKLPAMGKGLGEGIRNFRNAFKEGVSDEKEQAEKKTDKKLP